MVDVSMPNGDVVSFPDDMPKEQIKGLIASKFPEETKKMDLSPLQSGMASFTNMVPGGPDLFGAIGAAAYGQNDPRPFGEKQAAAKQLLETAAKQSYEQNPKSTIAGTASGIIAPALMIPAKAFQGGSVAQSALKGGAVAGGYGAVSGFGRGNTLDDRITNAITTGTMAIPFGIGGSLAADAVGAVAPSVVRGTRSLAERARNILGRIKGQAAQQGIGTTQQSLIGALQKPLNQPVNVQASGSGIPLTQGQITQEPAKQALEYGAQAGVYGDDAQRMALEAREIQSEAAKQALGGGDELAALASADNIKKTLKSAYQGAKAKTSAAYGKVGDMTQDDPLKIAGSYVRETVFPSMKDWMRKGDNGLGFDLNAEGWNQAKRLYNQAEIAGKAEKLTGMNFSRLEMWRSKVSQRIAQSKDPAERKFLGGLMQRYDTAMNTLPREAIKSGDDAIVDLMQKARMARKEQGVLFEKSKIVKDIIQNDDLTSEQLANTLTSLGPKTGTYVRDILRSAKEPVIKEQLREDLKNAVLGNILNKSLSAEVKAGSSVASVDKMVSFDKLATNLEKLVKNQSLLKQIIPDEASRKSLQDTLRQVQLIKSTKPGTKNYSNSAYTLLNYVRQISPALEKSTVPFIGSMGGGLDRWGQGAAALDLQKSLSPVLKGFSDDMTNPVINLGKKYGRQIFTGGAVEQAINNSVLQKTPPQALVPAIDMNMEQQWQQ